MEYAKLIGIALALVTVVVVLWDWLDDLGNDTSAADTLKSLRG
ncbi:hypothetical protein ADP64_000081 [Achromobacter phage phiAxp-2]|uniref:Uncharacterized protein n=1 Tax=Achromobacter phage phiAxp-2 TaxID=1664246 RepID=A0A0K2FHF7_9CAUD|nr:hypothetical protein ADP64_000081 [Achromobacter phage phiAxp-2]ALA45389.1 hypothetical protein ADP64_000081 [Achromobacter phage phiAxp-2]